MGASAIFPYAPNGIPIKETTSSTSWLMLGLSGTGYTSYAALVAASDAVYPSYADRKNQHYRWSVEPGIFFNYFSFLSDGGAGVIGSAFYVTINHGAQTPTDAVDGIIIGSNDVGNFFGKVYNVWYRKTVASDSITFIPAY